MAFVPVLQSLVVSIAAWYNNAPPSGKSHASSSSEFPAVATPCRPSSEVIRSFLREHKCQKDLSERLMNMDDTMNMDDADEMIGDTSAQDDNDKDVKDDQMMCEESKQEPPDHIKLVMEV